MEQVKLGLFQRNTFTDDSQHYKIVNSSSISGTNLGTPKTLLVVGLGNIGKEFDGSRHNLGFEVLDYFAKSNDFPAWSLSKSRFCHETSLEISGKKVILAKPTTFMNDSGKCVRAMQDFYKINPEQTIVIHDELDINFGEIRTRNGGGSAGNNGIKSIIQASNDNFGRIRMGIGPKKPDQIDTADFVLGKFSKAEAENLNEIKTELASLLSEYISLGHLNEETRHIIIWA